MRGSVRSVRKHWFPRPARPPGVRCKVRCLKLRGFSGVGLALPHVCCGKPGIPYVSLGGNACAYTRVGVGLVVSLTHSPIPPKPDILHTYHAQCGHYAHILHTYASHRIHIHTREHTCTHVSRAGQAWHVPPCPDLCIHVCAPRANRTHATMSDHVITC